MEQLQAIEKEVQQLDGSKKELSDLKDQLNEKKGERSELLLKREVRLFALLSLGAAMDCISPFFAESA